MKINTYFRSLFTTVFLFSLIGFGQAQCPAAFYPTSQSDIDNFIINYPNCTDLPGNLNIYNLGLITNLEGLKNLKSVDGDLYIRFCPQLTNLMGLRNLESVSGFFAIRNTDKLTDLQGLNKLKTVGTRFTVYQNISLTSISGLDELTTVKELHIENSHAMVTLAGPPKLTAATNYMRIESNNNLTTITGFDKLASCGNYLSVSYNPNLTDIDALENLKEVERLTIEGNDQLGSIHGLRNVCAIDGSIIIAFNNLLPSCHVQAICDHLAVTTTDVMITDNDSGCNSIAEVNTACANAAYPIATTTVDQCTNITTIDISTAQGNNNEFINILDANGDILCGINANGNELGSTNFELFLPATNRATDFPVLNRDISITPTTQPTSEVRLRLYYTAAEFQALQNTDPNISTYADIGVVKSPGACNGIVDDGIYIPQSKSGLYGGGDIYVEIAITSFSSFNGGSAISILPIELSAFKASARAKDVKLSWTTASEKNNDYVLVESSQNGIDFRAIGKVQGAGTSTIAQHYSLLDPTPFVGINYYRLKQFDLDGKSTYSNIISAQFGTTENQLSEIYPNPSRSGLVKLDYFSTTQETILIRVYDLTGRVVLQRTSSVTPASNHLNFDFSGLGKGIFVLQVRGENQQFQRRLVLR